MEKKLKKIVATLRLRDIHACLDGHREIWGCGRTKELAVGDVVTAHVDAFGIPQAEMGAVVKMHRTQERIGAHLIENAQRFGLEIDDQAKGQIP